MWCGRRAGLRAAAPAHWPWPQVVARSSYRATSDALDGADDDEERERFARFRQRARRGGEVGCGEPGADRPRRRPEHRPRRAAGLRASSRRPSAAIECWLLLTHRTDAVVAPEVVELLGDIARTGTTCRFEGLTPDEVHDFIEARGEAADPQTVQRVCELTDGVPFLMEQVLDNGLHHGQGPLPDPVRRLVGDRLRALQPTERSVIQAGAVLGSPLVVPELAVVSGVAEVRARRCVPALPGARPAAPERVVRVRLHARAGEGGGAQHAVTGAAG